MPIKRSIQQDFIICLEDGKKLKMLKRHLATRYNMTPEDYRRRWGLAKDYPMVAPAYAAALGARPANRSRPQTAAKAPAAETGPTAKASLRRVGGRRKAGT